MHSLLSGLLLLAAVWGDTCPGDKSLGPCRQNMCPQDEAVCDVAAQLCCHPEDMLADPTSPAPCRDRINILTGLSDCPFKKHLCNNTRYSATMHDECPLTCGWCTPSRVSTVKPVCADKVDSNGNNTCPAHQEFCTDPAWKDVMREECAETCGYC